MKRGLGRGLSALLPDDQRPASSSGVTQAPIGTVDPNPAQPRQVFEPAALAELAASLRQFGVLVPLLVRRRGDRFELIAGERRLRAAKLAGLTEVPVLVREADDQQSAEVAVVENLQRANLDPLEEAMGFAHLLDEYDYTQDQLAERIGKSRPAVANALRLLDLPDAIKRHVHEGKLSAGHARALLALPEDQRELVALRAIREGLTVRIIEGLARSDRPKPPKRRPKTPVIEDLEHRLRMRFATAATVERRGKAGRIELRFTDDQDLLRLTDLLLGDVPPASPQ